MGSECAFQLMISFHMFPRLISLLANRLATSTRLPHVQVAVVIATTTAADHSRDLNLSLLRNPRPLAPIIDCLSYNNSLLRHRWEAMLPLSGCLLPVPPLAVPLAV
jgi:hypothetical protein